MKTGEVFVFRIKVGTWKPQQRRPVIFIINIKVNHEILPQANRI
jgi:hypothetical protein